MTPPATVLYHYWRSTSSYRVRWALFHKGVAFESVPVSLLEGDQHTPSHHARSPLGVVPALTLDGHTLTESVAICEYLEETRPARPLFPASPYLRARTRQLVEIVNSGTQPLQNMIVQKRLSDDKEAQRAWSNFFVTRGLAAFEAVLAELRAEQALEGPFCLGTQTIADIFLVPQLYAARRFQVDVAAFPRCLAAEAASQATGEYERARPEAWQPAPA